MSNRLPNGILRQHIIDAVRDLAHGASHPFGDSTGYDVLFDGRRYAPKAVVGLAAGKLTGEPLGPYDFKGGLNTKCFRILEEAGLTIVSKGETHPFPDEIEETGEHTEGAVQRVLVNRYERNPDARAKAIRHHGARCLVCCFDFSVTYGALGDGFIHVHHTVPLAEIGACYVVDPINDLRPVCPNCHAMLHKRVPSYTIDELRAILKTASFQAEPALHDLANDGTKL